MTHGDGYHGKQAGKRTLACALAITGTWCLVELVSGFLTNSLALLADAGHMLSDMGALALSLFALQISSLPPTEQKTYGYRRAEILAALVNGLFLAVVAVYIGIEAYDRLLSPPKVQSGLMLTVASLGLVANLITARILYPAQQGSLNIRGAFLHVIADALGSIGAITAGVIMFFWQWYVADPIISMLVALLVLYSSWHLLRESVDVLLEGTPRNLNVSSMLRDLGRVEGVVSIHDLHVWSITSAMPAMSCHVVVERELDGTRILSDLSNVLKEKYEIEHTTIQIERETWVVPQNGPTPLF